MHVNYAVLFLLNFLSITPPRSDLLNAIPANLAGMYCLGMRNITWKISCVLNILSVCLFIIISLGVGGGLNYYKGTCLMSHDIVNGLSMWATTLLLVNLACCFWCSCLLKTAVIFEEYCPKGCVHASVAKHWCGHTSVLQLKAVLWL